LKNSGFSFAFFEFIFDAVSHEILALLSGFWSEIQAVDFKAG